MNKTTIPRLNRHFRMQWEEAQNCHVLLYPEGMVKLNDSASLILGCVDGSRSVGDIIADLSARFPDVEDIAGDIEEFMAIASARRWIEPV